MPCEVCGAHPTWYDLSECGRGDCPWEADPGKPIPPLPTEQWNPPPVQPVAAPTPAAKTGAPKPPLPAAVSATAPQPHSWEGRVEKLMEGMAPPSPDQTPKAPEQKSWAALAAQAPAQQAGPSRQPASAPPPVRPPVQPTPAARPARQLSTEQQQDYDEIMRYVGGMNWSGNHGPTCRIQTPIAWTNRACRELYLHVRDELHDQPFQAGGRTLYFYVGKIGNWGKAGFRISGHTKPVAKLQNAQTCGVLHVDN